MKTDLTIMCIREHLMSYFKDNCVQNFTYNEFMRWDAITGDRRYQYRREEDERQRKRLLYIGDIPLLEVQRQPNVVRLYGKTLTANDILKKINGEINSMLHDYLPGVKVETVDKGTTAVTRLGKWMACSELLDENQAADPFTTEPLRPASVLSHYASTLQWATTPSVSAEPGAIYGFNFYERPMEDGDGDD